MRTGITERRPRISEDEIVDAMIEYLYEHPKARRGRKHVAYRRFTRDQLRVVLKSAFELRRDH